MRLMRRSPPYGLMVAVCDQFETLADSLSVRTRFLAVDRCVVATSGPAPCSTLGSTLGSYCVHIQMPSHGQFVLLFAIFNLPVLSKVILVDEKSLILLLSESRRLW